MLVTSLLIASLSLAIEKPATGWNFRNESTGGKNLLVNLLGSSIPFAKTEAERAANHDPRPSLQTMYSTREAYLAKTRAVVDQLVKDRYLLAEDAAAEMKRAEDQWNFATR